RRPAHGVAVPQPRGRGRRGGISGARRRSSRRAVPGLRRGGFGAPARPSLRPRPRAGPRLTALPGSVVTMRTSGIAVAALVGAVGYRLVVGGGLTLDTRLGRRVRPLGPLPATI